MNSAGRAVAVLIQCRPLRNIENDIVYKPSIKDQSVIDEMLNKGKRDLSHLPMVLYVEIGSLIGLVDSTFTG